MLNISPNRFNNITFGLTSSSGSDKNGRGSEIGENAAGAAGAVTATATFAKGAKAIEKANGAAKGALTSFERFQNAAKACKSAILAHVDNLAKKCGLSFVSKALRNPVITKTIGALGGLLAIGVLVDDLTKTVSAAASVAD